MIERYTLPDMAKIWSDTNKFQKWLDIEILVCEAQAELGVIPKEAVQVIRRKAKFDVNRIAELEQSIQHDVISFLTNLSEHIGTESRYLHVGLTSYDVLDTSLSLLMKEAGEIILKDLENCADTLRNLAQKYKYTWMIGRTHGIHAEPITFGLKMLSWLAEVQRNISRFKKAVDTISYGKISGAVGTYAEIDPRVEEYVCNKLQLKPAPVSTQILQRDQHAEYLTTLSIIAGSLERFATEIRNLQRTEVREVEEYFASTQRGSSAMPHKRNPITCERICGLARIVRTNAISALENIALWHERDITHSSVERVIIPDSTILIDYMLVKFNQVLQQLIIYPENMQRNLSLTGSLICSQRLLIQLTHKGLSRDQAYELVKRNAMKSWEQQLDFKELVLNDTEITRLLSSQEIEDCLKISFPVQSVEKIYQRMGV